MDPNCFFLLDQLTLSLRLALRSWAHQHVSIAIFHAQRPNIAKCQALRKYPWKSQTTCLFPGNFAALANRFWCFWMICLLWCARQKWNASLGQWHVLWTMDLMSLSFGCFQNVNHGRIRNFPSEDCTAGKSEWLAPVLQLLAYLAMTAKAPKAAVKSLGTSNSSHIVRANPKHFTIQKVDPYPFHPA